MNNQGRNEIRVNNSDGMCLLENWVEERSVDHIDPTKLPEGCTSKAQVLRNGHAGLLSTEFDARAEDLTNVRISYQPPRGGNVRQLGAREAMMHRAFHQIASDEVEREYAYNMEEGSKTSVMQDDFKRPDFVPTKQTPTAHHDYRSDQPVTFWTEHREVMPGVSQVKTLDTVFRKNSSFSKPIHEYWDQPQPYELEVVPKM